MPLPSQSVYYIVAWANGVNSVHADRAGADRHVKSMRGEIDSWALKQRGEERVAKWRKTSARIIVVQPIAEELV